MFTRESCDFCGECFTRCPEMELCPEEAKAEIRALAEGGFGGHALTRCSSCFSCNLYCPNAANPYDLVLERWNDRYRRQGSPALYRIVCPTEEPNLWSSFYAVVPEGVRRILDSWMEQEPEEEVLLLGSFNYLIPEVFYGSRLLEGPAALSLPQHWECGAYLYQAGYLDLVKRVGEMVKEDLDSWGVKRAVVSMDAVYHVFTRVQPDEMGVSFSQEFTNFYEWIIDRFDKGLLEISRPLGLTVTVHDNCYSKAGGDRYFGQARKLLDLAGCDVVEMEHCKGDSLCCGFGQGASWSRGTDIPFDIIAGAMRRIREAERTGTDTLVVYCGGCMWLLLAAAELMGSHMKVVHVVELLRHAMGETVEMPRRDRAWDILTVITYQMLKDLFRKPFRIGEVRASAGCKAWYGAPRGTLNLVRRFLSTGVGRAVYRSSFKVVSALADKRKGR